MTDSRKIKSGRFHMLQVVALLMAVTVSQVALADTKKESEKSVEKIWEELQAAVKAGDMTKEEAVKEITIIKKDRYKNDKSSVDTYFKKEWAKLMAEVKAGKMTKEEAGKKMAAIKKAKLGCKGCGCGNKRDVELWAIWKKLLAEVKAGNMTQAEADAKMTAIKEKR